MTRKAKIIRLQDYKPPEYHIPETKLKFDIFEDYVLVTADLMITAAKERQNSSLILNGERLELVSISIDGKELPDNSYTVTDEELIINDVPESFQLHTEVKINPYINTWLEGLYASGDILCTQNEPEGFRKITYFLDRSDVMSVFYVTIIADKKRFPFLLSNGNKTGEKELENGRHKVEWHDPFPKPSYLFALVAGDFAVTEDSFTTASGRDVVLRIYVDHGNENRVAHTMASLKRAMRWDEVTYGLEYDLDLFMIVAVDAFNMGAMENKGLNIFNSACALVNPETATDHDYLNVDSIVAHEYFHNWTGDRITLRDWFQLTLKEGLTVYRDGEYTADTYSRPIKRIESATNLRTVQFAEDAGPNAHPIKPEFYREINNFYTATVYSKGAEVIRMLETLLGKDGFRRGMDRYVELFDGQAVTTEDFLYAMESANNVELKQFRRWYNQAGTPVCTVTGEYNDAEQTFTLNVKQFCAPTADGSPKEPFYIPMLTGLLDETGNDIPLILKGDQEDDTRQLSRLLIVDKEENQFVFTGIKNKPVPSLFRNFSAPVKVDYDYTTNDLIFLLRHDSDSFCRYDAGQKLALRELLKMISELQNGKMPQVNEDVLDAFGSLIGAEKEDLAFCAHALVLPSLSVINQEMAVYDFKNSFVAREMFKSAMATKYAEMLKKCYMDYAMDSYIFDPASVAKRRFRNLCLDLLSYLDGNGVELAFSQFKNSNNMTDMMAALQVLCIANTPERDEALDIFMERYKNDFNVINKWFAVQSSAVRNPALYNNVCELIKHPLFNKTNPNRLRSVYGAFAGTLPAFHDESGRGYKLIADIAIEIDKSNSLMSAGFGKAFKHYARMPENNKKLMRRELERILAMPEISTGLQEVVSNTLKE